MTTPNHFTQASRLAAQCEPTGFLRWVLGSAAERYRFRAWLEPLPLASDSPCDLVADLVEKSIVALPWAVGVAFRNAPDPDLFGRLLEFLGHTWRELRPSEQPAQRYLVAAAVVNLTGQGRTSRTMQFGDGMRTVLDLREINLAEKEAVLLLDAIAEGKQSLALLPWIPLLRGGTEESVRDRWKAVAEQEPDLDRRRDYACLAIVLADLVEAGAVWEHIWEGKDMQQSAHVLGWQEEARLKATQETKATCVIDLLEGRFGKKLPGTVTIQIKAIDDPAQLDALFRSAITVASLAEFRKQLKD